MVAPLVCAGGACCAATLAAVQECDDDVALSAAQCANQEHNVDVEAASTGAAAAGASSSTDNNKRPSSHSNQGGGGGGPYYPSAMSFDSSASAAAAPPNHFAADDAALSSSSMPATATTTSAPLTASSAMPTTTTMQRQKQPKKARLLSSSTHDDNNDRYFISGFHSLQKRRRDRHHFFRNSVVDDCDQADDEGGGEDGPILRKVTINEHGGGEVEVDYNSVTNDNDAVRALPPTSGDYSASFLSHGLVGYVDGNFALGRMKDVIPDHSCYHVRFNPDSTLLAVGLRNGKGVALYDTRTFTVIHLIECDDTVSALEWSSSSPPSSLTKPHNGDNYESDVGGALSSWILAVGGFDGTVSLYNVVVQRRGEVSASLMRETRVGSEVRCAAFVNAAAYAPDQSLVLLAIGERNGTVSFWSVDENDGHLQPPPTVIDKHDGPVLAMSCSPDGSLLATATKSGVVRVQRVLVAPRSGSGGKTAAKAKDQKGNMSAPVASLGHKVLELRRSGPVRTVAFSSDSTKFVAGGYDTTLIVVDTNLWMISKEIDVGGAVNTVTYNASDQYLAVGSRDNSLIIYDASTYHAIKTLHTPGWVTSIAFGTGRHDGIVAVRCGSRLISLIGLRATHELKKVKMRSGRGDGTSLSWSYDGRFVARADGRGVAVADSLRGFVDVARLSRDDSVRCVRFCAAEGKRDLLAVVGICGDLSIYQLRSSMKSFYLERVHSKFVESDLWSVGWAPDGSFLAAGGRGKKLHILESSDLRPRRPPLQLEGRVHAIDLISNLGFTDRFSSVALAVGTGDYMATLFDIKTFEPTLQIKRPRTVHCLSYHASLPLLAVGDGNNTVVIVDLQEEELLAEISVGGRVHGVSFSPCGSFLAVASDNCVFTIHETSTFKAVQEIPSYGFATSVSFSSRNGQWLALDSTEGDTRMICLGTFLGTDFIPVHDDALNDLPGWAVDEAVYRSGHGPSLLQRCMRLGSQQSLMVAARILQEHPEAAFASDRSNSETCYDTALELQKPNLLKLVMTPLVDGTLEAENREKGSVLTTSIPRAGLSTLQEMILNHPPEAAVEILNKITFVKVPFTEPRVCSASDPKECGSSSFSDPWGSPLPSRKTLKRSKNLHDLGAKGRNDLLRTPALLPLPGLGTLEFLSALTARAPPEAFDNDAMGLVLRVMWFRYIRRLFVLDISLYIMFFVIWVFFVDWTASTTSERSDWTSSELIALVLVVAFNTLFSLKEFKQSGWGRRREHLWSLWNVNDLLAAALVYSYSISTIFRGVGNGLVPLAVVTTLCQTIKMVAYLRGFSSTGWLISVLTQNLLDVRGFVIVLATILIGFTCMFRSLFGDIEGACTLSLDSKTNQLSQECDKDPYGDLSDSLLSTFELAILGSYDPAILEESRYTPLAVLTFILAITVVLVVALNALIAVLGDSYSRVQENATANRRKERAELVVEYLSLLPDRKRRHIEKNSQYFHALLEADADGDLLVNQGDWQGGLNALKKDLYEQNARSEETTRRAFDELKSELNYDIDALRQELTSILSDIAAEVGELKQIQRDGGVTFNNANVAKAVKAVKSIGMNLPVINGRRQTGIRRTTIQSQGMGSVASAKLDDVNE